MSKNGGRGKRLGLSFWLDFIYTIKVQLGRVFFSPDAEQCLNFEFGGGFQRDYSVSVTNMRLVPNLPPKARTMS